MRKIIVALLSMGLAGLLPPIAHAQFGSGIVFDPTQSGHAIVQIEHEEQSISNQMQQIENGQQIFSNTVKIASTALQTYNQIVQQYNLYHEMMVAPQTLYGRFLSPQTDLMMTQQIANHYGNGSGAPWVNSSNTGTAAASSIQLASLPPLTATIPTSQRQNIRGTAATRRTRRDRGSGRFDSCHRTPDHWNNQGQSDRAGGRHYCSRKRHKYDRFLAGNGDGGLATNKSRAASPTPHHAGREPDQRQCCAATDGLAEAAAGRDESQSFRDSSGYESYYNANIATTSSGAANLLTQAY